MYTRHIKLELDAAMADTPVVLLNGARQTGKSTLAQAIAQASGIPYVTLDDATRLAAASTDAQGFLAGLGDRAVIDEVQKAPGLFPAIKMSVDSDRRPGCILICSTIRHAARKLWYFRDEAIIEEWIETAMDLGRPLPG